MVDGPDPGNRVDDQDIGSPDRPISVVLQDPFADLPAAFCLQNILQLHQQR